MDLIVGQNDGRLGEEVFMKKFIVLTLILAMLLMTLVGCTQAKKEKKQAEKIEQLQELYAENWSENNGCYDQDVLPTKETAEAVAQQIFDSIKEEYGKENCVWSFTVYYEAQNAWMVHFGIPPTEDGVYTMGAGCTIALNKANGQVMRVFWG